MFFMRNISFYICTVGKCSLSKLCELVFGKALNKDCQMSDWEALTLSPSQINYAALDAHCLLGLLDVLLDRLGVRLESNIPSILGKTGIPYGIGVRGKYDVPGYTFRQIQEGIEVENKGEIKTNINDFEDFKLSKISKYCETISVEKIRAENRKKNAEEIKMEKQRRIRYEIIKKE